MAVGIWSVWVVVSLGIIAHGRTLLRVERAEALYRDGAPDEAIAAFEELEADFRRRPWMARAAPGLRDRALESYLTLLYRQGEYDRVIVEGEAALLDAAGHGPALGYWLGNAYYRKAVSGDVEEEEALAWLRRAGEQYRNALVDGSDDWDAKYNHELVQSLLRAVDEQPDQEVFDLLRPDDEPSPQQPSRKIG